MVLLDHGGRHPREVQLIAPPPELGWLVEHLWIQGSHGVVTDLHAALRAASADNVPVVQDAAARLM